MFSPLEIIETAIHEYKPYKVFALFSGGNDSICATHLAAQASQFDGAVFVDTGIKVQQTLDHARAVAARFGWPFRVVETPMSYDEFVLKNGFPGPAMHKRMYIILKERALDKLIRETKTERMQNILLITGVRRYESRRRMVSVKSPIVKDGSKIWTAPMWEWTDEIKAAYMEKHDLPENPVKKIMHVSGDCLCGAFNDKGDLALLQMFYPAEAQHILDLQEKVMQTHPWKWDEQAPEWFLQYSNGQQFLGDAFMPMCWNCEKANEASVGEGQP